MSQNIGNLVRREINIFGMQLGRFMPSLKTWLPIFQLTGTYFIGMQMKMYLLDLGLLVWMLSILMIEASAVGHLLIANGRRKLVTLVLHRLTGAVVVYANQWKGWKRFTSAVERAMGQFGTQASETLLEALP